MRAAVEEAGWSGVEEGGGVFELCAIWGKGGGVGV